MKNVFFLFSLLFLYSCTRQPSVDTSVHGLPADVLSPAQLQKVSKHYDNVLAFEDGVSVVQSNGYYGLINHEGQVIIKADCDTVYKIDNKRYIIVRNNLYGAIDSLGRQILAIDNDEVEDFVYTEKYLAVNRNGKWGIVDNSGKAITPIGFDHVEAYDDCYVVSRNDMSSLMSYKGDILIDYEYNDIFPHILSNPSINPYGAGMARFNGKIAVLSPDNRVITKCIYDEIDFSVYDNILVVARGKNRNQRKGAINVITGDIVIPVEYDDLGHYSEGLFTAERDGKYGYIDNKNNVVIPFQYDTAYEFSEGLAMVAKSYTRPGYLANGMHYGFVDKTGRVVIPITLDEPFRAYPHEFHEGLCGMGKDFTGKGIIPKSYGYINTSGIFVIEPIYQEVTQFRDGLAFVQRNNKWGVINREGYPIISCDYDYRGFFGDNYIEMTGAKGQKFYFDKEGNAIKRPF